MPNYYSYFEAEEQDGSIYYAFSTDHNLGYTVYFKMDEYTEYMTDFPLLLQKGYAFGFHRKKFNPTAKNKKDELVFETIYKIILDFLKQRGNETILLYHCDGTDGRQASRNQLFNDWAKIINSRRTFFKHSIEVVLEDGSDEPNSVFLGFIADLENPIIDQVKREFEEFSINLVAPKD